MNDFKIPDDFWQKIDEFDKILKKFNEIHSLTNYDKNLKKVVKDSIKPLEFLDFYPKKAIDIGSGAGIPAVFLAMILKECSWTLFEPNPKKSSFLTYTKIALNLENIKVINQKIECSDKFIADLITSRALMKTPDLIKICKGFYDDKTQFLIYKGSEINSELDDKLKKCAKIYKGDEPNRNYLLLKGIK